MHITRLCCAQLYLHTWTPAHARAHTSAHTQNARIGGAAAHNGPRRIDALPSASRLRWRAARAGEAAHTNSNEVTAAVFHAPMFALNAFADLNACAPSHPRSTPTERARMSRRGCVRAQSHTHTRAHTDAARGRVCGGPASAIRSSGCQDTHGYRENHALCIRILCICVFHRWPNEERASHSHTCRA